MIQKLKNHYHLIQSLIANIIYGFPAKKLTIIGVTGTDGKTTTTSMIYHILRETGLSTAMISTLSAQIGDEIIDTGQHVTTPEPWDLPRILKKMVKAGIKYVVLESTSSGLDQNRLFGIQYDSSIITNIGHDHLDYHKTWENYAKAKFKIVTKTTGYTYLNKDHESKSWLEQHIKKQNISWFSIDDLTNKKHSIEGLQFDYNNTKFQIPIIGEYNYSNAIAAIKLTKNYIAIQKVADALKTFKAPTGRMEMIQTKPYSIIIDFAHTPSSLESALLSVNKIKIPKARIITVFGCAGDRDPDRRQMGAVSVKLSDITITTLEDPRAEPVEKINSEIITYAKEIGGKITHRFKTHEDFDKDKKEILGKVKSKSIISFDYSDINNRKDAVNFAISIAKENDIVFITGKGHEQSLAIGNPAVEHPYTDHEAVSLPNPS